MLARTDILSPIDINITRNYNEISRQFEANIDFTALEDLTDEFNFNIILVEDSIVWDQAGSLGGPDYVHDWTVRDMMNGASGELLINGYWQSGVTISKNIIHNVPIPNSPAPDIRPQFCRVIVLVYKVGAPLSSNAEIQQAIQVPLIKAAYAAEVTALQTDILGENTLSAQFPLMLVNTGSMNDTYYLSLKFKGLINWMTSFSTINGSFLPGMIDSVNINSGQYKEIQVEINANSLDGYGKATLEFQSKTRPQVTGEIDLRFVTKGVDHLVIDDDKNKTYENYVEVVMDSLQLNYGVLGSKIVLTYPVAELNNFHSLIWQTGTTKPALTEIEMNFISQYLDNGGNIYLNGLEIPYQLGDPNSAFYSQNTIDFFTNYLHAQYIHRNSAFMVAQGVAGDSITGNINRMFLMGGSGANIISVTNGRYANQIDAADSLASPIFSFYFFPTEIIGIKAKHLGNNTNGLVVFTSFGFETIAEESNRVILVEGLYNWFNIITNVENRYNAAGMHTFDLKQNYPNPFNSTTKISFELPDQKSGNKIALIIYDQLGKKVKTLIDGYRNSGYYHDYWDGKNDAGKSVSSGVYFYQLRYGENYLNRKMILLQ